MTDTKLLNYILKNAYVMATGGRRAEDRENSFNKYTKFVFRIEVPGRRKGLTRRAIELAMKRCKCGASDCPRLTKGKGYGCEWEA